MGRVKPIRLTKVGLKAAFAARLKEIATAEGLDGRPIAAYKRRVHVNRGDFRRCLQAVEMGEMAREPDLSPAQRKAVANLANSATSE